MAKDVMLVLDEIGIAKAHVLGVSLGGMVTLQLALDFPQRIESIIVINSSLAGTWKPRLSPKGIFTLVYGGVHPTRINELLAKVLISPKLDSNRTRRIISEWNKLQENEGVPTKTVLKQLYAASRFNVGEKLRKISVPTLLIHSDDDRLVPSSHTRKIHSLIPGSELAIVRNSSHEPTLDQPDQVCGLLESFFQRHGHPLREIK